MASNPGLQWSTAVKPLLSASYSSFNKQDLPEFTRAIVNSEKEILTHEEDYEPFYSSFVALASHFVSASASNLSKATLTQTTAACRVLLQFLLQRLKTRDEGCTIAPKYHVILIKGLCKGGPCLSKSDVVTFSSMLKAARCPPHIKDRDTSDTPSEPKETKQRPRLDTGSNLFTRLTAVFDEVASSPGGKVEGAVETINTEGDSTVVHIPDPVEELVALFARKNLGSLLQLDGANVLLDACLRLPFLSKYVQRYQDAAAGASFLMPATLSEALTTRTGYTHLLSDISIVWRSFSLPVLEPLTPDRLEKIVRVTMSCLYASVTVAVSNTIINMMKPSGNQPGPGKEEELEGCGTSIVQKTLEIFSLVSTALRNSTRAGGNVCQNLNMLGSWVLMKGLQGILSLTPATVLERKDSSKSRTGDTAKPRDTSSSASSGRPSSGKSVVQGFGVISVALGNHAVQLFTSLLEDLQIEGPTKNLQPTASDVGQGMEVDVASSLPAVTRVRKLLASVNLTDLLFNLVSVSFKKASQLNRVKQGSETPETSSSSTSDSNTYYEDDFSSSQDTSEEEDDDSEPILGQWFEETLSPNEGQSAATSSPPPSRAEGGGGGEGKQRGRHASDSNSPNFIPDKREPTGFVALATSVLNFLHSYLVSSSDREFRSLMTSSLGEEHVATLATLIKELDKECARLASDKVYEELSVALARFNHGLIANECLSDKLQDVLLSALGVFPQCDEPWPLTLYPRTLAVLAEILLLRQQREQESARLSSSSSDAAIISIWQRFLYTLKTVVLNPFGKADHQDDVNVEHLQLLLFLFHSLHLQKKKVLLQMLCQTIVSIATTDSSKLEEMVPLPLSRLMLVFEYQLHYFYDPPSLLMEQVQYNLFGVHTPSAGTAEREGHAKPCQFFACREVQENFRKHLSPQEAAEVGLMKPRFYYLGPADASTHDAPKLDGLATNVIMSSGEFFSYNQLYSACITLLMAGSRCDKAKEKLALLESSAMHYHFLIMWRLLACLPPSVAYVQSLERREVTLTNSLVLHTLRWAPRLGVKPFTAWVKEYLVKQGQTAQQAEALVTSASKASNTMEFDVQIAMQFIRNQIADLPMVGPQEILAPSKLPGLSSILMLDAVMAKVSVALNTIFAKLSSTEGDSEKAVDLAQDLIPATFHLIEAYSVFVRSSVLGDVAKMDETTLTPQRLRAFATVMSIGSGQSSRASALGSSLLAMLPSSVRSAIDKWTSASGNEFPSLVAWKNAFANDLIPCESYMDAIHSAHMVSLSGQSPFNINASMRHVLSSLMRFIMDLLGWVPNSSSSREYVRVMFPLLYDINMQYLSEQVTSILETFLGSSDGDQFLQKMYEHLYSVCHDLIVNYSDTESGLDEKIFHECLKFMENHLEKAAAKKACEAFYTDQADLTTLLLTAARENLSHQFSARVLKFFNRLFQLAEKSGGDRSYEALCRQLCRLASVEQPVLQALLTKMTTSQPGAQDAEAGSPKENRYLLLCLVQAMVKEKSTVYEEVALSLLQALIPMGGPLLASVRGEMSDFPELMVIMQTLAGAGRGQGHLHLFKSATSWLQHCKAHVSQKDVLEKVLTDGKAGKGMLETLCCLLSYVGEILGALKRTTDRAGSASPPPDSEGAGQQDPESDWAEDMGQDDDDSGGEDSDEESLNNKLCTFTITQKEFMNQHWYHCHTCKMVDGVGVCTICAKVCHKDHDITYAKFGSFFCDCGAKEDGSCKALVKRTPQSGLDYSGNASQSAFAMDAVHPSSLRRRMSTPGQDDRGADSSKNADLLNKHREALARQIESYKTELLMHLESSRLVGTVVEMLELIVPRLTESYQDLSPMGSSSRAQRALHQLHTLAKKVEVTADQLMTVTLGSQEGAFENVRINFSGEQGQQIRQLITAHMLRRVAMCVLSSPHGKRQHLAVSHEKGKITILQLSALLKQADSSKKKLTLTRLSAAPIPFTVLSITGNPCNEDFLAVCGLKDCHVLTFTSSGSVADHLVLHPSLATGNFIIKAVWLPGSQTELAIVTADFVKIYDLSVDALSPMYYFLLPSGKVRDATFICTEEGRHMVLMSSSGYMYTQAMEEVSSARHGPFYITNVLEVKYFDLKDNNGQVAGGGVSVYYSHALQLLFFSYAQGKSFASPVSKDLWQTTSMFPISFKSSNGGGGKGSSSLQPLVHFTEVPGHTGLLYCMAQTSNNPVVLMVKPDTITMQEIKVVPSKAKIQDVVAIRHVASNSDQQRTTMILLCEDGSLRIYMANVDSTDFWLSPYLQPQSPIAVLKPPRKKKASKSGRPSGSVNFPVDFFEHCQQTNDVEFGGNDVLQIYNQQQVKTRLNTTGMYIANTKPSGYSFEITNNSNSTVMVGVRVLVGSQSPERAPSTLEIFGRSIPLTLTRPRWFDLPFTREESLTADKKFTLFVGPSQDPSGVTMVDQIKVYVKTKEVFGWPEETDEFPETSSQKVAVSTGGTTPDTEVLPSAPIPMTTADKLLSCALEVLDGAFATSKAPDDDDPQRRRTLEIATSLLTLPTPVEVQQYTKSLLASLFPSKTAYHNHKDQAQLGHVMRSLSGEETDMDVEGFQRLVVTARSVAVSRPTNLIKFAERGDSLEESLSSKDSGSGTPPTPLSPPVSGGTCHFMAQLMETFWKLHAAKPPNAMLAPVCLPGLPHVDVTVGALVEIIHAITMSDLDSLHLAASLYLRLLLSPDPAVSFSSRQAMIRVLRPRHRRRRVFIPSPPRCSSPCNGGDDDDDDDDGKGDKSETPPSEQQVLQEQGVVDHDPDAELEDQFEVVEGGEPMVLDAGEGNDQPAALQGLEELWDRDPGNFPPIVDIPPDADDETMVELAIALSLQDPGLGLARQAQSASSIEEGQLSDTTASAPGSDDEVGSNAATDGSTLRTSPAEHGGSIGSESGGSAVDSISVSGRSSAYGGYQAQETGGGGGRSETSSVGAPGSTVGHETTFTIEPDHDYDTACRLHSLRLLLLEKLLEHLPQIREFGGVRAIPFMQVVLMLTSDLDSEEDKDRAALDHLLQTVLSQLDLQAKDLDKMASRTKAFEVKLILLRLLSVLLSRSRSSGKTSADASTFLSSSTATALISSNAIGYCLQVLQGLLPFWKQFSVQEAEGGSAPGTLLKPHPSSPPPDMSPFFMRQYVKSHANDVFEDYPQLLTEMVLRLPYQLKKIADSVQTVPTAAFDPLWHNILSEYMMTQQTPFVKKQVRKLLLFICGSKERYRQLRDQHAIHSHLTAVVDMCQTGGLDLGLPVPSPHSLSLPYDTLLAMIEHLKICSEVASSRPHNWQTYCEQNQKMLSFLVKASIVLDEGIAPTLLQLLQAAICSPKSAATSSAPTTSAASPSRHRRDKDKGESKVRDHKDRRDKKKRKGKDEESQRVDEALCVTLVKLLNKVLDSELFIKFVRTFLLESNSSGNRWLAHSLVHQIYRHSSQEQQESMLNEMWGLWSELPAHGRKAAQFVDLLGYFVLKTPTLSDQKVKEYLGRAVEVLRTENCLLANHPNATIYNMLQGLVDFDGYYLESDPCLVCNNPEVPFASLKLSAIKLDSKFTTSTQIVKLVGSHTISKITLRISDLKRTKMVKTMNIYYNNRSVQAVVELRNRPGLWHKAKKVTLSAGQVDVKVEFPIPIVACNLMIEYADFYDNLQATAETLQCPRCSASVPANPGVCGNCGENVYQCHKCRAINYDEKDPFLCNACGFCKYAKFDFTLTAKPCCAVDPIENEEDRKKAISTINSLLEKADKIYKQLQTQRPVLENLLYQVAEHSSDKLGAREGAVATGTVTASSVNKAIQMLAQKYCGECKSNFDELSKIIQKVLASRRELVEYDRQQREAAATGHPPPSIFSPRVVEVPACSATSQASSSCPSSSSTSGTAAIPGEKSSVMSLRQRKVESKGGNCYGCASAAVEHCITLLRALVTNIGMRQVLCTQGMIQELIDYNLRHGTLVVRNEVRRLLCLLTKDNRRGTEEMNNLIMNRITSAIRGHQANPDLGSSVRHELMLLAASLHQEDSCWEQRVRCVMKLFLMGMHLKSPVIMDSITLPCLRILQDIVRHDTPAAKKKETPEVEIAEGLLPATFHMDVRKWLAGDPRYSFSNWRKRLPHRASATPEEEEKKQADKRAVRALYLQEKYALRWKQRMWKTPAVQLRLTQTTWLKTAMFSPSSRSARQTACSIIEAIAQVPARRKEVIDMLTVCLEDVGTSGEYASEFLELYKRLIQPDHWKIYLAIKGLLPRLGNLITMEVEHLEYLEETTLSSDLAQGFSLKALTELLSLFVEQPMLKSRYKNRLVGYILNGYLSLRKLLVQRTKLVDDTQDKLLELLEELTTGTAVETREFMAVCVKTVKKYPLDDYRSPVFIFERLCSIIYPEENDVGEFYVILEKDPQQEDFLQGRMLGNPYSSNEPGMGPLMRDIKNKICQDCELVALLEDDTGMELLVNKKIISLDLPVKEVYKKIWLPEHGEGEPMPIIYRMRGLLGDATEDMVNSLDTSNEEDIDKEEVFKMASVLSECGGLQVMLQRLASIKDLTLGKQLMVVLLKLFGFALNVKANRQDLIRPELNTVGIMLGALNLALWAEQEAGASVNKGQTITEQILQIMEIIFLEASQQPPEVYTKFSRLCGDKHQLMTLLDRINSPFVRANPTVLQALMRLIPFLAFGEEDKMLALINHFKPYLHFHKFDVEHSQDEQVHLDCFCVVANGIENNANGRKLKDMMNEHGVVAKAVSYILENAPEIKTLLATDSEVWKEFLGKPALGYVLRLLRGLCMGHVPTQDKIAEGCIPILHKLEQVSSDKHIGTMSENLLDTLKENAEAAKKIEEIRKETRVEKKRLAMAVRKKQLGALGMTTNDKGQVTVKSSVLKQMEELKEETGLVCCICREGYKYQPQKVLAVYTFTKRANVDEFENKARKTVGYSTVSHFNIIHVDCHTAAVRHNRGREEWDSAALQNANTKCNGLLPLWGPQVAESVFANCLARHNNYLSECTGIRDPSYQLTIHDIKMNLLRFAQERSFSEDSGGGGRQSNMHLLPYMMHMALYVINSTRCQAREEKNVQAFLELPRERWLENCFESEGAFYYPVLAMHVLTLDKWKEIRAKMADRLLISAHVRAVCQPGAKTVGDKSVQEYTTYRYALVFFGLVNCFFEKIIRKVVVSSTEGGQTSALADFIRQNDRQVLELCDRLLAAYEEELLPCESLAEVYDVTGLLEDVANPDEHLTTILAGLP